MTKIELNSLRKKQDEDEALFVGGAVEGGTTDGDGPADDSDDDAGVTYDDASHTRLLNDVMKLNKKKSNETKRKVRTSLGGTTDGVDTSHLLDLLKAPKLKENTSKLKTLPTPTEKIVARRAKRAAGYEDVMIESEKWAPIVHRQRRADTLSFPLHPPDLRPVEVQKNEERQWKPKSQLEQDVYGLLQGAKLVENKKETEEEQAIKRAMSLQEIRERNRELWRLREMRRRYEEKAMRQNKSKSRKHHRILRREKLKKQRAEIEELQRKDPEAALGVLEELERARIEERMSLRHKKSKWAHLQAPRAQRDKQVMANLKENQRIHRELITKMSKKGGDGDDDDDEDTTKKIVEMLKEREMAIENGTYDPLNPWTNNLSHLPGDSIGGLEEEEGGQESFTKFVQFWDDYNKRREVEAKIQEEMERREEEELEEETVVMKRNTVEEEEEAEDDEEEIEEEKWDDFDGGEDEEEESTHGKKKKKNNVNKTKGKSAKTSTSEEKVTPKKKCKKGKKMKGEDEATEKKKGKKKGSQERSTIEDSLEEDKESISIKKKKKKASLEDGKETINKKRVKRKNSVNEDKSNEESLEEVAEERPKKTKKLKTNKDKLEESKLNSNQENSEDTSAKKRGKKAALKKKIEEQKERKTGKNVKRKDAQKTEEINVEKKGNINKENKKKGKGKKTANLDGTSPKKMKKKGVKRDGTSAEEVQNNLVDDAATSIDMLFDEAEAGLKSAVKRKLEKLNTLETEEDQKWNQSKRKKQPPKNEVKGLPEEEFDFTITDDTEKIDERLERNAIPTDESPAEGNNILEKAITTLRKDAQQNKSGEIISGKNKTSQSSSTKGKKNVNVDPTKFMEVNAKRLVTAMPNVIGGGGEEALDDDEEEEQDDDDPEAVIREAFADDYLIDEFNAEKAAAMERDRPKNMSLALPGWGDWTGPNIKMSKRKQKKFKVKTPQSLRKDANLSNVIYNEKADLHDNLRKAMVSDLPYPFKSVKDFEASVRAPVGRMFIPDAAHRRMTQPPVVTKLGRVIEPMSEESLLKKRDSWRDKIAKKQKEAEKKKKEEGKEGRGRGGRGGGGGRGRGGRGGRGGGR